MNSREAKRLWRESIHRAWGHRCAFCDGRPVENEPLTIDHVKPKSKGGEDRTANCVSCCKRCNRSKGNRHWVEWYREQDFYSEWREVEIRHWLNSGEVPGMDEVA